MLSRWAKRPLRQINRHRGYVTNWFRPFVCLALTVLLGLHTIAFFWSSGNNSLTGDFSDIKYIVMQLSRSLSDVNKKHVHLQTEIERIATGLPQEKAKDALVHSRRGESQRIGEILDYDRQITDFALESAGAKVIDIGDTVDHLAYESVPNWFLQTIVSWMCRDCVGARSIIQPNTLPGECWAFKGSKAEATIRLLGTVRITGFSIEHIPWQISPTREISSAPRLCQVEGLEYRSDNYPHDYGSFEYNKDGKPIQYFPVVHPSNRGFNIVRLRVLSNWGHPVYTCLYRFRVHGELILPGQGQKSTSGGADDATSEMIENE